MSREELCYQAKLAEHAERYKDMIGYMKNLIEDVDGELNDDERTLLSVAYKQAVGECRTAWRTISYYEEKMKGRGSEHLGLIEDYKIKIRNDLDRLCGELIDLVDHKLLKEGEPTESRVFYLKMKGDYYRYRSEAGEQEPVQNGLQAYQQAQEEAKSLPVNNPIKLGLLLNFSVFYYEVMSDTAKACEMAKSTFEEAMPTIEDLDERAYKEASSILSLLKDNLTLWSNEED